MMLFNKNFGIIDRSKTDEVREQCFAALLYRDWFHNYSKGADHAEKANIYMSAVPFAKDLTLSEAYKYVEAFRQKNPNCFWARLVAADEIEQFNAYVKPFGLEIKQAKTSSVATDEQGKVVHHYCWDNGLKPDVASERSDVYLQFVLKADAPQKVNL